MDEKPVVAPLTVASTVDAQGNVVVWDNGEPGSGVLPKSSIMAAGDATHALTADPGRYSLEPRGVDDGAVAAKIKEIRDRREATKKSAQARLDAAELAVDRKEAISAVMADQAAAAVAKAADDLVAGRKKVSDKAAADKVEAGRQAEYGKEKERIWKTPDNSGAPPPAKPVPANPPVKSE